MKIKDLIHDLKRFPENADVELVLTMQGYSSTLSIKWAMNGIGYADNYYLPSQNEIVTGG